MSETRRLVAIMAVDVVGFSRLMGEDEAGTAASVREHRDAARPLVASKGGRIVKTMGDGLLLEFPSVVAAVDCALAIQDLTAERNADVPEAKRIVYRIGVNLGDVLIDGDDILGDGVNVAARLESICEPGGVLISGAAYEQTRGKVKASFIDLGERALKNIGPPVRVYAVKSETSCAAPAAAPRSEGRPRLSLVVLPFANLGGGEEHEYFVDGVTENLTTDLSRIGGAFVIARNTAFTFKGKAVDVKQIGRELNVRYALEGSVQRGANRLRINVQLIDADSGHHLWAERFDKPLADLFEMQDEIVARLAAALNAQLVAAEAKRAEKLPNQDANDLYYQGMAWFNKGSAAECLAKARGFFDGALSLDPDHVDALVSLAFVLRLMAAHSLVADIPATFQDAETKLNRALSLAPDHARAHANLGMLYIWTRRTLQGIAECEHALELDRNLAVAHASMGWAKVFTRRYDETQAHVEQALRLSPRDPLASTWLHAVGAAKLHAGQFEEAATWYRRSVEANRNVAVAQFWLGAALARAGRWDEARACVRTALALNPTYTIARAREDGIRLFKDEIAYRAEIEPTFEALRLAGAPEQ